ncbi:hypothetical protein PN450_03455 [Dolichospermum lemmermannii CS-548]|uniref:hypothetical protein n=1 Tax=Dolichospermum lemmermannii TaxID=54295 RepID=UPI00233091F2|nr:hypothetical protein [Dolichospermum lemmermannii]MDB9435881.1 hypothetical protein [Dolichospermum lemmermannii CS-548]
MQLAITSPLEALNHPLPVHQFLQTAAELPYSQLTTSNHWRKLSINFSKPITATIGVTNQYSINQERYKFRLYYDLRNWHIGRVRQTA